MLGVAAQRIAWPIRKPRNNADECHCGETRRDGAFRAICFVAPLARGACHGRRVASRISSRKASVAATRDLFRGSLMELTLGITLAVLGAGFLHAGWNALLKSAPGGDSLLDTATVVAGVWPWGLGGRSFVPRPARPGGAANGPVPPGPLPALPQPPPGRRYPG